MVNHARHGLDRDRQYLGFADGLRALAMLGVVGYELVRVLPRGGLHPAILRAAQSSSNAVALFYVISGLVLAYPLLNQLHHKRRADFDPAVYALKRVARIFPAYLAVLALLVLVPLTAGFYGIHAVAGPVPPLDQVLRQAIFAGNSLGNDGMWTLAVTMRWYVLFPLLIVLWTRAPAAFVGIALLAGSTDALLPVAHGWALGAAVPFMLGIVAAEALVKDDKAFRFALPAALVAGAAAFALDPFLATLPGPAGAPVPFPANPFWAIAFAALAVAAGRIPYLEQILELAPLRLLGQISFAVSLTVVPAIAFAVRQLATSPASSIALNAFALSMVCGFALWQLVDRWFADYKFRGRLGRALGTYLDRYGGRSLSNRVRLLAEGEPPKAPTRNTTIVKMHAQTSSALMERVGESRGPIVTMRTGSQADLAAEIIETRRRLAEHAAAYFAEEVAARRNGMTASELVSGPVRLERGQPDTAAEADPLAAALGHGVKISVRSRKKPK
ncbi:MAG: acyltransferase family protein [Vulcanimicrobiaceae bacterium]